MIEEKITFYFDIFIYFIAFLIIRIISTAGITLMPPHYLGTI